MNSTQIQTTSAALVAGLAGFAAGHGWLGLNAEQWGAIFVALIAAWPAVVTRLQSLKNTVGKSGALVVTNTASANALPDNKNVVSPGQVTAGSLETAK